MDTTIQFYDSFGEAFESHTRMAEELKSLVKDTNSEMRETCEEDDVRKLSDVLEAKRWLESLDTANSQYINKANEVITRLGRDKDRVIGDLRSYSIPSFQSLTEYLKRSLEECERIYQTIREHIRSFTKSCSRAEAICQKLAEEAETKKTATRVAGGVTTGAVAVGGITASIFVGIFTAGIGTAIGVPLTLAATVVTAGAAGTTTALVAHHFSKAAGNFRKMRNKFECLNKNITKVDNCLLQSRDNLSSVYSSILHQDPEKLVNSLKKVEKHANIKAIANAADVVKFM